MVLAETAYAELCADNVDLLGDMLHDAWQLKKRLTNGISNAMVDDAYQAAIDAGAGGGGF